MFTSRSDHFPLMPTWNKYTVDTFIDDIHYFSDFLSTSKFQDHVRVCAATVHKRMLRHLCGRLALQACLNGFKFVLATIILNNLQLWICLQEGYVNNGEFM